MGGSVSRVLGERDLAASFVHAAEVLRKQLEVVWSSSTAHHSVDYDAAESPSAGQCYVSSMAFARLAERRWPDVDVLICRGALLHGGDIVLADHGWVEARVGRVAHLIDLTVEQGVSDVAWIADPREAVSRRGFDYRARERLPLAAVASADAWLRYWLLEAALVERFGREALVRPVGA